MDSEQLDGWIWMYKAGIEYDYGHDYGYGLR